MTLGLVMAVSPAHAALTASAELQSDSPVAVVSPQQPIYPSFASAGTRGVVVSEGQYGFQFGLYAQRFDLTTLAPLDTSPVLLGSSTTDPGSIHVACDANQCLAVWGADAVIYGRRFSVADGALPDAAPIIISSATGTRTGARAVAVAGGYYVAWNDRRSSGTFIIGTAVSSAGVVATPTGTVIAQGLNQRSGLALAANDTDLLAVWQDSRDSTSAPRIYAARLSPAGVPLDANGFAVTAAGQATNGPHVAWDGATFRIVFGVSTGLLLTSVNDLGQVGTVTPLSGPPSVTERRIACGGGQCAIGWLDNTTSSTQSTQMLTRVDGTGAELGDSLLATSKPLLGAAPEVAFDSTRFVAVFSQADLAATTAPANYFRLSARAVGLDGALGSDGPLLSTVANAQKAPSIAFNGSEYLLVWTDMRADTAGDIWGARFAANGSLLDVNGIAISTAKGAQQDAAVASNGSDFLVTWADKRGSDFDIFATRISAGGAVLEPSGLALDTAFLDQTHPHVVSDGTDYLVTWNHGNNVDINGVRVTAAGQLPDPFGVVVADGTPDQENANVIWDGSQYVAAWHENTHYVLSRLTKAGVRVDVPAISVVTSTDSLVPGLVTTPAGYLVAWRGFTDIATATVSLIGEVSQQSTLVPMASSAPVLLNGGGSYLAAWQDSSSPHQLHYRPTNASGAPLDAEAVLATAIDNNALTPVGVSAGKNRYAIAYSHFEPDRPYGNLRVAWKILSDDSGTGGSGGSGGTGGGASAGAGGTQTGAGGSSAGAGGSNSGTGGAVAGGGANGGAGGAIAVGGATEGGNSGSPGEGGASNGGESSGSSGDTSSSGAAGVTSGGAGNAAAGSGNMMSGAGAAGISSAIGGTDSGASAGASASSAAATSHDSSSCSCRAAGSGSRSSSLFAGALVALLAALRRRRAH